MDYHTLMKLTRINPGEKEIINVGVKAGMKKKESILII